MKNENVGLKALPTLATEGKHKVIHQNKKVLQYFKQIIFFIGTLLLY